MKYLLLVCTVMTATLSLAQSSDPQGSSVEAQAQATAAPALKLTLGEAERIALAHQIALSVEQHGVRLHEMGSDRAVAARVVPGATEYRMVRARGFPGDAAAIATTLRKSVVMRILFAPPPSGRSSRSDSSLPAVRALPNRACAVLCEEPYRLDCAELWP